MILWGLNDGGSNTLSLIIMLLAILSLIVSCIIMIPFIMSWGLTTHNVIRINTHSYGLYKIGGQTIVKDETDAGIGYVIIVFFLLIVSFPIQLLIWFIFSIVVLVSKKDVQQEEDKIIQATISTLFLLVTLVLTAVAWIPVAVYSSKTKPEDIFLTISNLSLNEPFHNGTADLYFTFTASHKSDDYQTLDGFLNFNFNNYSYSVRCGHGMNNNSMEYRTRVEDSIFINAVKIKYSSINISYNVSDIKFKKRTYHFDYTNKEKCLILPVQKV